MTFTEALPTINACLNGTATILLTLGFIFIKSGKIFPHRVSMVSAFLVSAIFLFFYLLHKYLVCRGYTLRLRVKGFGNRFIM